MMRYDQSFLLDQVHRQPERSIFVSNSIRMLRIAFIALVACFAAAIAQAPSPCITPVQFSLRASQFDHKNDVINRFYIAYDALNRRRAIFEEQDIVFPGRQFFQYLVLNNVNIAYEINLSKKTCTRSIPQPWRPYGIPPNATFETEYYIGGPGEQVFAQEWSDRVPNRQRERWVGVFTLLNCYPVREVFIADYEQLNSTVTTNFYDVVQGIPNPNDFIPPPECLTAPWAKPTRKVPRV